MIRSGPGNAGVWIAIGDGEERQILFEAGVPVTSSARASMSYEKRADLFLISVDDEHYEIPEALIYGD